jgi:hypothetical protein
MENKNLRRGVLTLDRKKLKETYRMSPEMKLLWLEEANNFINAISAHKKRKT